MSYILSIPRKHHFALQISPGDYIQFKMDHDLVYIIKTDDPEGSKVSKNTQVYIPVQIREHFNTNANEVIRLIHTDGNKGVLGVVPSHIKQVTQDEPQVLKALGSRNIFAPSEKTKYNVTALSSDEVTVHGVVEVNGNITRALKDAQLLFPEHIIICVTPA